jgi:hypothetical protein
MNPENQNTNPEANSPKDNPKPRLPFKEVTIRPRDELRQRILEIQLKTGKTASAILEELLCKAAGMPINWTVIEPKNGQDAGVSLNEVEKALSNVFFALREVKGIIKSHGSREVQFKVDALVTVAMMLWAHAQSLAKSTFYDDTGLAAGRRAFRFITSWRAQRQAKLTEELAKGEAGDAAAIKEHKVVISEYDEVLKVLTRLGFSPTGPIR